MWVIKIFDNNVRKQLLVRDCFFDKRVLLFETEEAALRFAVRLSEITHDNYGIKCRPIRFQSDPKKESFKKMSDKMTNSMLENLRSYLLD